MPNISDAVALNPGDNLHTTIDTSGTATPFMPSQSIVPIAVISQSLALNPIINPVKKPVALVPTNPSGTGGVPKALLSGSVVQSPTIVPGIEGVIEQITVEFTYNLTDPNFQSVNVWFVGYKGSANPALVSSGTTSPFNFFCNATGEKVKVYLQTVGTTGAVAPLQYALGTTVTLNGVVSNPPAPTINQYVMPTPTGYQFAFNQVQLAAGTQDVISTYNAYRNSSNTTTGATVFSTFKHDPTNNGNPIVVQDNVTLGTVMYYWITSVNTKGLESTQTACQTSGNYAFQPIPALSNIFSAQQTPTANVTGLNFTSTAFNSCNPIIVPGQFVFEVITQQPGVDYVLDVILWDSNDTNGYPNGYVFHFDNRSGYRPGQLYGIAHGASFVMGTPKTPVNASRLPIGTYRVFCEYNADGLMNIYVNGIWAYTLTDLTFPFGPPGTPNMLYGYELNAPSVAPYVMNSNIFTSGELLSQGSISAAGVNTFSYASTTTTIKWTWTSFIIYNPDGSSFTVPANSSGTTFSGLTLSTTYYFAFYVTMSTGVCTVVLSDQSGGKADCSVAFIVHTINGDGYVGINWNVTAATTASGGGGGYGGGIGGGGCFTPTSQLLDGRTIKDIQVGDTVWVEGADGVRVQRQVKVVLDYEHNGLLYHVGGDTWCTPNHRFRVKGQWVRADHLFVESQHYKGPVHNLHIDTDDEEERNYVLWNGLAAHNQKQLP